jgi:hypothetical protein
VTPERWQQVCALFAAALRCAPAEREVMLREACAGDPGLRTEVDRLLAGDARADEDGFLGSSQSVTLELDTAWDQIASAAGIGIQSRSQNR